MRKLLLIILLCSTVAFGQRRRTLYHQLQSTFAIGYVAPATPSTDTSINGAFTLNVANSGIVQGLVTDQVAKKNRDTLNYKLQLAHQLGDTIFQFSDSIYAYFDVQADNYNRAPEQGVFIPGDMHFKMHDSVWLYVQPNAKPSYALLTSTREDNITISGGHLIGDRYTHTYATGTDGDTHEFGYGIYLRGAHNVVIDNVHIESMTGDAIIVQSTQHRNDDGSEKPEGHYNKNWTIRNCYLNKSRRNNISLTDIDSITIHNNTITNGGDGGYWSSAEGYNSKGVLPRYNIDLEAINYLDDTGDLRYTEVVKNVVIRNNDFSGAYNGDIDLYKSWAVEIHDNTFDSYIANVASYDIEIHHNTFTNTGALSDRKFAIQVTERLRSDGSDFCQDYVIYDNTITGFEVGIKLGATSNEVYNNDINNCLTGIMLLNGADNSFTNNDIDSNVSGSRGYYTLSTGPTVTNTTITNCDIDVAEYGALFQNLNSTATSNEITITGVNFKAFQDIELRNTHWLTLNSCIYTTYNAINGSANITINNP